MERIPISFEHRGKKYSGSFSRVQGAGTTSVWHLMSDDNYFLGRLRMSEEFDFFFDDSKEENELTYLARFFGNYIHERT